jgi:predicted nucleic acid-binding protein
MNRYVLDTNEVIRFLRNDHPTMSQAAAALFQESACGQSSKPPIILGFPGK